MKESSGTDATCSSSCSSSSSSDMSMKLRLTRGTDLSVKMGQRPSRRARVAEWLPLLHRVETEEERFERKGLVRERCVFSWHGVDSWTQEGRDDVERLASVLDRGQKVDVRREGSRGTEDRNDDGKSGREDEGIGFGEGRGRVLSRIRSGLGGGSGFERGDWQKDKGVEGL